jgi:hypothetical protein
MELQFELGCWIQNEVSLHSTRASQKLIKVTSPCRLANNQSQEVSAFCGQKQQLSANAKKEAHFCLAHCFALLGSVSVP